MQSFAHRGPRSSGGAHERSWKGFCEIESEPALFNAMLHEFGVRGVQVREVVSLDDDMLRTLPRPVHGLIFLYKWTDMSTNGQEQACPPNIWFANQTVDNACASVALLNIVNNIPNARLGDNLSAFKEFSMDLSPPLKGAAVANFEYVRAIHNSFARRIDMLSTDLALKDSARSKAANTANQSDENGTSAAFHFIAFMPIGEQLWKLDGLERQPLSLGHVEEDWLAIAKADIETKMSRYDEDRIEFAVLGLVQDPVYELLARIVSVIEAIHQVTTCLDDLNTAWRNGEPEDQLDDALRLRIRAKYDDLQCSLDMPAIIDTEFEHIRASEDIEAIKRYRRKLIDQQASLKQDLKEEEQSADTELSKAATRKQDFGAKVQRFVRLVEARKRSDPPP